MNEWLIAATVLIGALIVCGTVCYFTDFINGLIVVEVAGVVATTALLLLAEGFHRQSFVDLALVFVFLTFVGALFFVRLMERRL